MAKQEHLDILKQGVKAWNEWRESNLRVEADLAGAYLARANLTRANLRGAILTGAYLTEADLTEADLTLANLTKADLPRVALTEADLTEADLPWANLSGADLTGADLPWANLTKANLTKADLTKADLTKADLTKADLTGADLTGADLTGADLANATLVEANLESADLTGCKIYGISAWDLKVNKETKQSGLIITKGSQPTISVDDLEVAQFIYLLLNREKLRKIIDTITSKAVLILGRFTPERKAVLDAMADELRSRNLLPIIFDFERATSRDFTETIKTLAGMSRFVIADITNPKSALLELQATIPDYQTPFVPIIQEGEKPLSMFADLTKYPWVSKVFKYQSPEGLIAAFKKAIIDQAFDKYKALLKMKAQGVKTINVRDFLAESS